MILSFPFPLFLCLHFSNLQIMFSSFPSLHFSHSWILRCFYILAPEKPEVTIRRIDSTSVIVSWTLNSGNEGIHYFLVTYRKLSDGSDKHTINTTQTEIKITGLEPGVEYEFEVSVQSVVFFSHSTSEHKPKDNQKDKKMEWTKRWNLDIEGAISFLHVSLRDQQSQRIQSNSELLIVLIFSVFLYLVSRNNDVQLLIGFRLLQRTAWDLAQKVKKPKHKAKQQVKTILCVLPRIFLSFVGSVTTVSVFLFELLVFLIIIYLHYIWFMSTLCYWPGSLSILA